MLLLITSSLLLAAPPCATLASAPARVHLEPAVTPARASSSFASTKRLIEPVSPDAVSSRWRRRFRYDTRGAERVSASARAADTTPCVAGFAALGIASRRLACGSETDPKEIPRRRSDRGPRGLQPPRGRCLRGGFERRGNLSLWSFSKSPVFRS